MTALSRLIVLLSTVLLLQGCSAVFLEGRFIPHTEDYQNSGYNAETRSIDPGRMVVEAAKDPELILKSSDYELFLLASPQTDRLLTAGPCILIPLPVVPVIFFTDTPNELKFHISISSLLQRRIRLDDIIMNINQSGTTGTKSYTFTRNVASSTGNIEFDASFPIRPDHIEKIDLYINILEDEKQKFSFPSIHLYPSTALVWGICVM